MWGTVLYVTRQSGVATVIGQGIAVLALLVMMVISYFILRAVSDAKREWTGSDLSRAHEGAGAE